MKKSSFLINFTFVVFSLFLFASCSKETQPQEEIQDELSEDSFNVVGSAEFIKHVLEIKLPITKAGEVVNESEVFDSIAPLFKPSIDFLKANGYDYSEDFEDDDPCIILTAFYLLSFEEYLAQTKGVSFSVVVNCAVGALGIRDLYNVVFGNIATKVAAKLAAEYLAERAIPWFGTLIMATDFVWCVIDNWEDGEPAPDPMPGYDEDENPID